MERPRLVIGISGATGAIYGIRLLEHLRGAGGRGTPSGCQQMGGGDHPPWRPIIPPAQVRALAHVSYGWDDLASAISSGSFRTWGMAVLPCSMKTVSAIANGYGHDLLTRAADVTLKERRPLVLCPRETPLSTIHLENMLKTKPAGGADCPAYA